MFDREANGDVAPKRIIHGPETKLRGGGQIAVDPVRNLLVFNGGGRILIFDRTARGNVAPKRVIEGPTSGVVQVGYNAVLVSPSKGLIIAACRGGSTCAWSIDSDGDAAPRWKIPVHKLTGYIGSGIALDPAHKEIVLSAVSGPTGQERTFLPRPKTGFMNAVLTFSWPEVF